MACFCTTCNFRITDFLSVCRFLFISLPLFDVMKVVLLVSTSTPHQACACLCRPATTTRGLGRACISCARAGLTRQGRGQAALGVATACTLLRDRRPAVSVPRGRTATAGGTALRALRASILQAVATTAATVLRELTRAAALLHACLCLQDSTTRCGAAATTGTMVARRRRWQEQ